MNVPQSGDFRFFLTSDDGSKLFVNGEEVISNDRIQGPTEVSGVKNLAAGPASIEVQYFEAGGGATVSLEWEGSGVGRQLVRAGGPAEDPPQPPEPPTPDPPAPEPPAPDAANLAAGRPAFSSSAENGSHPAGNAVDGNGGSRWSSQYNDDEWWHVDLGDTRRVTGVSIDWETAHSRAYRINGSVDGVTWFDLHVVNDSDGGNDTIPLSADVRYVGFHGIQRATQWGYSFWEFRVLG